MEVSCIKRTITEGHQSLGHGCVSRDPKGTFTDLKGVVDDKKSANSKTPIYSCQDNDM